MNALTIIAICLVSSAVLQGLGFYLYGAFYKRRYFKQHPMVGAQQFQTISGKSSVFTAPQVAGKQKAGALFSSHKQNQSTVDHLSRASSKSNPAVVASTSTKQDTVIVNK